MVPLGCRNAVMKGNHDDPLFSHGGYYKTLARIKREYYWPQMQRDIRSFVSGCETCKAIKPTNQTQMIPMGDQRVSYRPWQIIYIDFVGPFPRSKKGYSYLLVVVDGFSKFVNIFPLRNATSKAAVEHLENRIFLTYGVPEVLISDNGSQFISAEFNNFLNKYGVKKWLTARYHPQANAVEAANKTIETSIRAYIKDTKDHRSWDENLTKIACAINTSIHSSTKFSPYFVNFGQHMFISGEDYKRKFSGDSTRITDENFIKIRDIVQKNIRKTYETSKKRYDLRTRPINYNPGDIVWKQNFILSDATKNIASKLCPRYIKCIIKKKVGTNSYELSDENGKDLGIFNSRLLKR